MWKYPIQQRPVGKAGDNRYASDHSGFWYDWRWDASYDVYDATLIGTLKHFHKKIVTEGSIRGSKIGDVCRHGNRWADGGVCPDGQHEGFRWDNNQKEAYKERIRKKKEAK